MKLPSLNIPGTIGQAINRALDATPDVPASPSAIAAGDAGQLVSALGVAAGLTGIIDAGISTGAASVVLGDSGTMLTLPGSGGAIVPGLSSSTANPSSGAPAAAGTGARFEGDNGNNTIIGTASHDVATGAGGADTIHGGDGNDHLYGFGPTAGPDGGDVLFGGNGADYLQGNAGADMLDGGDGSDRILGGADNDVIFGQAGNDSVNGNFGDDQIDGGEGNDFLRGGKGNDLIHGGNGADILSGDLGADRLTGGAGADIFRFAGADAAVLATDLLADRAETIGDFANGEDRIALGFAPTGIVYGAAGDLSSALAYAQTLLGGAGGHGVAAVQIGADTLLFYGAGNGLLSDSAIRLTGIGNSQIDLGDFI